MTNRDYTNKKSYDQFIGMRLSYIFYIQRDMVVND